MMYEKPVYKKFSRVEAFTEAAAPYVAFVVFVVFVIPA